MTEAVLDIKQWGNNLGAACRPRWRGKRTCMSISAYAYQLKAIRS